MADVRIITRMGPGMAGKPATGLLVGLILVGGNPLENLTLIMKDGKIHRTQR